MNSEIQHNFRIRGCKTDWPRWSVNSILDDVSWNFEPTKK